MESFLGERGGEGKVCASLLWSEVNFWSVTNLFTRYSRCWQWDAYVYLYIDWVSFPRLITEALSLSFSFYSLYEFFITTFVRLSFFFLFFFPFFLFSLSLSPPLKRRWIVNWSFQMCCVVSFNLWVSFNFPPVIKYYKSFVIGSTSIIATTTITIIITTITIRVSLSCYFSSRKERWEDKRREKSSFPFQNTIIELALSPSSNWNLSQGKKLQGKKLEIAINIIVNHDEKGGNRSSFQDKKKKATDWLNNWETKVGFKINNKVNFKTINRLTRKRGLSIFQEAIFTSLHLYSRLCWTCWSRVNTQ